MKHLNVLPLLFWWFLAFQGGTSQTVGPFPSYDTCEQQRTSFAGSSPCYHDLTR